MPRQTDLREHWSGASGPYVRADVDPVAARPGQRCQAGDASEREDFLVVEHVVRPRAAVVVTCPHAGVGANDRPAARGSHEGARGRAGHHRGPCRSEGRTCADIDAVWGRRPQSGRSTRHIQKAPHGRPGQSVIHEAGAPARRLQHPRAHSAEVDRGRIHKRRREADGVPANRRPVIPSIGGPIRSGGTQGVYQEWIGGICRESAHRVNRRGRPEGDASVLLLPGAAVDTAKQPARRAAVCPKKDGGVCAVVHHEHRASAQIGDIGVVNVSPVRAGVEAPIDTPATVAAGINAARGGGIDNDGPNRPACQAGADRPRACVAVSVPQTAVRSGVDSARRVDSQSPYTSVAQAVVPRRPVRAAISASEHSSRWQRARHERPGVDGPIHRVYAEAIDVPVR